MKRALKILGFFLLLCLVLLIGGGAYLGYHAYRFHQFVTSVQTTMTEQQVVRRSLAEQGSVVETAVGPAIPTPAAPYTSACTVVYENYIANGKIMDVINSLVENWQEFTTLKEGHPCVQQVAAALSIDKITERMESCRQQVKAKKNVRPCQEVVAMMWGVFAETEYPEADPLTLSADALHGKIIFRLADPAFMKEADPKAKAYLYHLLDAMHRERPAVDYGTMREELIGELYTADPKAWRDDYEKTLADWEAKAPERAINLFLQANGKKLDEAFLAYVEGLEREYPKNAWVHFYKGCAYSGLKDWENASRALAVAEELEPRLKQNFGAKLREAIEAQRGFIATSSWSSLKMDLIGA